jgi:hypothetical protein
MGAVHGMVSTTTGSWRDPQVRTSTVASAEQRLELRLPGRGTYVLSCGAPVSLDHWLVRHVEVGPGQVLELEVPLADARLTGRLDRYHGDQGFSHHGTASPRLFLDGEVPEGPGWSLMVAMPERGADDRFELDPVPAGTYYTMHHLVDGDPIYGGAEVTVATGETGVIEGFGEAPRGAIRVRCVDANGDPVSGEVVIADPMWESWSEFQRYPTTARYASDRIPAPRPVDLVAGEAELAGVQAGLLRLEVRREDGRRYAYRVRTEPSATIVLLAP